MAVRFLVGRAGSGKTATCLRAATTGHEGDAFTLRRLLLVPEQASLQMEQALVQRCPRSAYSAIRVLSFSTLAALVMEETGYSGLVLSGAARRMALRHLSLNDEPLRRAFGAAAESSGFVRALDELLARLIRAGVSPQSLENLRHELPASADAELAAIGGVYERYMSWLGAGRIDAAAQLQVLRERISQLSWLSQADVWVDGFASFSGLELEALGELASHARSMTITLLLDPRSAAFHNPTLPPDPEELFAETLRTYQKLRRIFAGRGVMMEPPVELTPGCPPRFTAAPGMAALEAAWCSASPQPCTASAGACADSLRLIRAADVHDQIVAAAKYIRQRVADAGGAASFGDFALIARDVGAVADTVRSVFTEYQVPHFIDQRRPLAAHPLARALRFALDAALSDYSTEAMVQLLRTEMTPLSRADSEFLETMILTYEVRGRSCWARPAPWAFVDDAQSRRGNADLAQHPSSGHAPSFHDGRFELYGAIGALHAPETVADKPAASVWAKYLFDCLHGLRVRERLAEWARADEHAGQHESAETHRAAWQSVCEILQDIHDVLGEAPLALRDVAELVNDGLRSRTLGLAPPTLNQVLVSSIERSRHPDIREAWLLGWNDGVFPRPPTEAGILRADARRVLAEADVDVEREPLQQLRAERLLAYIALTRSSQCVTVSWAETGPEGEKSAPSRFVADLQHMFPGLSPQQADPAAIVSVKDAARSILNAAAPALGSACVLQQPALPSGSAERAEPVSAAAPGASAALRVLLENHAIFGAQVRKMLRGLSFPFHPQPVGNYRRPREGPPEIIWAPSPTEVETYIQCPYQHFLKYGLRLKPERGKPQPVESDLGSIAHRVLAHVGAAAIAADYKWNDEEWERALDDAIGAELASLSADLPQRRPRLAYLQRAMRGFLLERVRAIAASLAYGHARPRALEWQIGDRQSPTIVLELHDKQRVALYGKIDRIDVAPGAPRPLLILRDYKSTTTLLKSAQVLTSTRLQVWLYAIALAADSKAFDGGEPAAVLFDRLFPDYRCTDNTYFVDADAEDQALFPWRAEGAMTPEAARALDAKVEPNEWSLVAMLRRKKGDGEYDRTKSHVISREDFQARLEQARNTLRRAARGIAVGDISIAPLLDERTRACHTCKFRSICRFEPAEFKTRIAEECLPKLDDDPEPGEDDACD